MNEPDKKTRITKQKNLILEVLRGLTTHPTADELYTIVRSKIPNISLGTVYRNLEILAKAGSIRKLEMAGSQMRFDGRVDGHLHVRCCKCGAVSDLHEMPMPRLEELIPCDCDYAIHSYALEFSGLCPECKKNNDKQTTQKGEQNGLKRI